MKVATSSMELPVRKEPKVLFHFVRHGQAAHNVRSLDKKVAINMVDPPLTTLGVAQATHLSKNFPPMLRLTHALVSPSHRTLQTLLSGFRTTLISKDVTAIAYPSIRELSAAPCNRGRNLDELKLSMCGEPIDMRLVQDGWDLDGNESEKGWDPLKRVRVVKQELQALRKVLITGGMWKTFEFPRWDKDDNIEVLVVSHGGFLAELLCGQKETRAEAGDRNFFSNCQYRTASHPSEFAVAAGRSPSDLIQDVSTMAKWKKLTWERMGFDIKRDIEEAQRNWPDRMLVLGDDGKLYVRGFKKDDPEGYYLYKDII